MFLKRLLLTLMPMFCCATLAVADDAPQDVTDGNNPPIFLTLFLHDQLTPEELASMGPDYMSWFLKELTETTGRRVHVTRVTQKPGYTDFGYRLGDEQAALKDWQGRVSDYIHEHNLPVASKRHKYMLVTRYNLTPDTLGIAFLRQDAAIASLRAYGTIAHEAGHLLGATHDNAHTRFAKGLPCRTLMYASHTEFFPSCYVFSEKNRQAIRDYLK